MVCTEYPPMPGGIGRYTANLANSIEKKGFEVYIACDEKGDGHFSGLTPENQENSAILLKIAKDLKPDIVHVQFDPGLYGVRFDKKHPKKVETHVDQFYAECKIPIITTFHSSYPSFRRWMKVGALFKKTGRIGVIGIPVRTLLRLWKYSLNYHGFNNVYKDKLRKSKASIVFSEHISKKFGGRCQVIYHGSEPAIDGIPLNKTEARRNLSIPIDSEEERIVLAVGFTTDGKGWDILKRLDVPKGWKLVINSSKSYFNKENIQLDLQDAKNTIDLHRGYLNEKELSMLFCASDAVILPYRSTSSSGVMFDALAHGLPFISTDLDFFKEFAAHGLGISVKRNTNEFSKALKTLASNYEAYAKAVEAFKEKIKWDVIATKHSNVYNRVLGHASINDEL